MKVIKAPEFVSNRIATIFLAGSIEMGAAELWQDRVAALLKDTHWTLLNPRRDDWDSSWEQSINNPQFCEQVQWELQGIEDSEYVLLYFDPKTKSPITLLELGYVAGIDSQKLLVVCPEGYWRKGNVDVVCDRYRIKQFTSLEKAVEVLLRHK